MGYGCSYRWVSHRGVIAEVAVEQVAAVAVAFAQPAAAAVAVPLAARVLVVLLAAAVRPYDARSLASMFLQSVSFNRFLT